MTEVEIRPLGPDDDMDAQLDLVERVFGVVSAAERENRKRRVAENIAQGRFLGAFVQGRPAGSAAYLDMRQWWHGRPVPMAGVTSVKVAPEHRGRGIGRRMMTELLGQIAERGYPVSALYPATMPVYRSLGWEPAGGRYKVTVPSRELRSLLGPDSAAFPDDTVAFPEGGVRPHGSAAPGAEVRRATPDDAAEVIEVLGKVHEAGRHSGPLTRDAESVRRWLDRDAPYAYLAADGFLAYQWNGDDEMYAERIVAASAETCRALWSVLASHSSTARTIRAKLAPEDPLWWLTRERDVALAQRSLWMLRIVDAPAAIAGRGFPLSVSLSVPLVVRDPARPSNDGRWRLEIAGGKGTLTQEASSASATHAAVGAHAVGGAHVAGGAHEVGGAQTVGGAQAASGAHVAGRAHAASVGEDEPLTLGARGLAALYGGTPMTTLRHAGLVSGGSPDTDAALDAAFPGPSFMLDDF
ncbi:MAG: GNAT family N-acetyltransferase [Nocardiopsaceae bacterium]|nr:GNAT family N-acetyltransferase [Nocardiopsaceae bacterium]